MRQSSVRMGRAGKRKLVPRQTSFKSVAYLMLVALLFITINLSVDIAYAALDPRLRARKAT